MAINIDGLTAAGALDPNDLFEVQQAGVNKKLELGELWVIAKGINTLQLYKSATATTTTIIRPGVIHINDGTDDYLRENTSFSEVTITGATGWSFITCTQALVFTQRADSGGAAISARPSATCYSYVDGADTGYNHTKGGYYYDDDERIIGAVWWTGAEISHIIQNLNGTDEIGENSRGNWERFGRKQNCFGTTTCDHNISISNAYGATAGEMFRGNVTITFPVPFIVAPTPFHTPQYYGSFMSTWPSTTSMEGRVLHAASGTGASYAWKVDGYWRL